MTAFTDLLEAPRAERRYIAILEPYDPSGSPANGVTPLYFSTHGFTTAPADSPANQWFESRLEVALDFNRALFQSGKMSGRTIPGYGSLEINNADGALDVLATYSWGGRRVRVYLGGPGFDFDDFGLIFDGVVDKFGYRDMGYTLSLKDKQYLLDVEIQETLFAGSGGDEGGTDVAGKRKPRCYGFAGNVEPIFVGVDSGYYKYAVHDGNPIIAVVTVRDNGAALTFTSSLPSAGEWTFDRETGIIALGGAPVGRVTCDVLGDRFYTATGTTLSGGAYTPSSTPVVIDVGASNLPLAVGMWVQASDASNPLTRWVRGPITDYTGTLVTIAPDTWAAGGSVTSWEIYPYGSYARIGERIAGQASVTDFDADSLTTLDDALPYPVGIWVPEGGNGLEILDRLVAGTDVFYGFNRAGAFQMGRISASYDTGRTFTDVEIIDMERLQTEDPNYRVDLKYLRNHAVMTGDQLAGTVSDADRAFLTTEWRVASTTPDTVLQAAWQQSQPIIEETALVNGDLALALANGLAGMFGERRDYFTVTLKSQLYALDINQKIIIQRDRYGLSAGKEFIIVALRESSRDGTIVAEVWG